MLCTFQVPRVQIPHSTPYKGDTTGYLLFYYTNQRSVRDLKATVPTNILLRGQKQFSELFLGRAIFKRFY